MFISKKRHMEILKKECQIRYEEGYAKGNKKGYQEGKDSQGWIIDLAIKVGIELSSEKREIEDKYDSLKNNINNNYVKLSNKYKRLSKTSKKYRTKIKAKEKELYYIEKALSNKC